MRYLSRICSAVFVLTTPHSFLAFNSVEFSCVPGLLLPGAAMEIPHRNKYFRPAAAPLSYPLVTLAGYLKFWAVVFVLVTAYLSFFQPEDTHVNPDEPDMDIRRVYSIMMTICRQPRALLCPILRTFALCQRTDVQSFIVLHLIAKIGTATNDAATSLKLLEKGLSKEDLALAVLIDFPFQIVGGWAAAKWSSGKRPLKPVRSSLALM